VLGATFVQAGQVHRGYAGSPREEAGQRREDGPVWPEGAWSAELSAQDRDLVAQDEIAAFLDACARASGLSQPQKIR